MVRVKPACSWPWTSPTHDDVCDWLTDWLTDLAQLVCSGLSVAPRVCSQHVSTPPSYNTAVMSLDVSRGEKQEFEEAGLFLNGGLLLLPSWCCVSVRGRLSQAQHAHSAANSLLLQTSLQRKLSVLFNRLAFHESKIWQTLESCCRLRQAAAPLTAARGQRRSHSEPFCLNFTQNCLRNMIKFINILDLFPMTYYWLYSETFGNALRSTWALCGP